MKAKKKNLYVFVNSSYHTVCCINCCFIIKNVFILIVIDFLPLLTINVSSTLHVTKLLAGMLVTGLETITEVLHLDQIDFMKGNLVAENV